MRERSAPRIAMFLPALEGGGAERVMVQLANAFERRGIRVEVLLATAAGPRLKELSSGVHVIELGGGGVIKAFPQLVRYLNNDPPAALLSTLDHANIVAAWSGALARTRGRIVLRQAMDPLGMPPSGLSSRVVGRLMGPSYRRASHIIVLAEHMRETMVARKGIDPARISVVRNPVPSERIRALALEELDHPWLRAARGERPLVVAAGRLTPQKDFSMLLNAVSRVARQTPVRLAILGEGPDQGALEAQARQLGVADVTVFPGFQQNPYPWMARADVIALSSRAEGMPNILLEAMALGRPVVSTDCPSGPKELLDSGRLGKLVPVGDDAAMAEAILQTIGGDHPSEEVLREAVAALGIDEIADAYIRLLVPHVEIGPSDVG